MVKTIQAVSSTFYLEISSARYSNSLLLNSAFNKALRHGHNSAKLLANL
jgi:hypothetical protein